MKSKLSARFWTALTIFSLMGQVAWVVENMYFNVFIYNMFNASPGDISAMVAASAAAATLTTVFMGALSDKIGKRKIFISFGYILWGITIFSFVFLKKEIIGALFPTAVSISAVGVTLTIILDCLMTFFGSTANDAAFNAWLTDSTDSSNRGSAEGINSMMPLLAILVVFGGFMFFDLSKSESWSIIFLVIGVLVFVIGILGLFIIEEPKLEPVRENYLKTIFYGFMPSTIKANPALYVSFAAFIIFNISIQIFMPYLIIYYEKSLMLDNYVLIMAPAIIVAAIATAFWGKIYDKKGFVFSGLISVLTLISGYVILFLSKNTAFVFIGSLLMMSGYLSGMAVFGAVIRDNTPSGKAGMLQGVRIFSQVLLPGVIGPYIGKLILSNAELITNSDGTTSFIPNEYIFLGALVAIIFVLPFFIVIKKNKMPRLVDLKTPFEKDLNKSSPFSEYPRPQFKRDSYLSLNGSWKLKIQNGNKIRYDGEITVPFCPESRISGVNLPILKNDTLIYTKSFSLDKSFIKDKVLLHFGAVDQFCVVYLNGQKICKNFGGYLPFSADITKHLIDGENILTVEAQDPLDKDFPYGKQTNKRGGMWYTKVSSIWQTVWIESVPENYIENIRITPDLKGVKVEVLGAEGEKSLKIKENGVVKEYSFTEDNIYVAVENPILWTPENPYLYEFELSTKNDKISSYFALRTVSVGEKNGKEYILLNDEPYLFHGLLDQGYYSDGIFLPASEKGFKKDIIEMKACGFNMLRKHIKLEPDIFYYYCDKYGMIVFQDMINSGKYSFIYDTALPTVAFKSWLTHRVSEKRKAEFFRTSKGIIDCLYNHPSVCYYTIFNEGWGQFQADKCYDIIKQWDNTRVYDTTSGWFHHKKSDVESEHVYFKPVKLKGPYKRPYVLSEFGGYSCKIEGHSFNLDNTYGYRYFTEPKAFEDAIVSLYETEITEAIRKGLCAAVMTQVSDVEDETNGFLTYDRQILKVDKERLRSLSKKLQQEFERNI